MNDDLRKFPLERVRIKGKFLSFKASQEYSATSPIVIPFGSVSCANEYNFYIGTGKPVSLVGSEKDCLDGEVIEILPGYEKRTKLKIDGFGDIKLKLWLVQKDVDKISASEIILRSHYLSSPNRGLILGCGFADENQQEEFVAYSRERNMRDNWSSAWHKPFCKMIGCAVVDNLFHGVPNGRRELAAKFGLSVDWDASRKEIVKQLRVAWISRFAVEAPYRNYGFGRLLAEHSRTIARDHRLPFAKHLEVITTLPKSRAESMLKGETRDFLVEAGYIRSEKMLDSSPTLRANVDGEKVFVSAKKLYYYTKL